MSDIKSTEPIWHQSCGQKLHNYFTNEFSCRGLGFSHARPSDFTESQWLWMKPWIFCTYRALLSVGFLMWISLDIPREIHNFYDGRTYIWFLYATNWAFGLLCLSFFFLAVFVLVYNCPKRREDRIILYQPIWFIYTIAVNGMIVASLVFWIALSDSNLRVFSSPFGRLKHSLTALLALADVCLSAIPVRLVHVIYPLLVGIFYSIFSYVFWLNGGKGPLKVGQVYPGLNWSHPKTAVLTCLSVILFSFLVQVLLYMIYYGRIKLSSKLNGRGFPDQGPSMKHGYGELGATSGTDVDNMDDSVSVTSMSTCVDPKMSRDYGAVE